MRVVVGALIALVAAVGIIIIAAATRPDTFDIKRSIVINAKPGKIESEIVDFHKWAYWSPYEKKDPAMKRIFSGSDAGIGAVYEWYGDSKVGSGRMEITDITPSKVTIKLDFFKPFEGHDTAEYLFEPEGEATKVTWDMHGRARFIGKVMGLFMSMDKMVGKDFDEGLENLKRVSEG